MYICICLYVNTNIYIILSRITYVSALEYSHHILPKEYKSPRRRLRVVFRKISCRCKATNKLAPSTSRLSIPNSGWSWDTVPLPKKHGLLEVLEAVWDIWVICFVSKSLRNLDQKGIGLADWVTLGWTIGGPMTTRKKIPFHPEHHFHKKNIYISFVSQESLTIFSFPSQFCLPNQNHSTTKNLLISPDLR